MKLPNFIRKEIQTDKQVVHIEAIPSSDACYAELSSTVAPRIIAALKKMGIEKLYSHQVEAMDNAFSGKNIAISTGTASGKTLCYIVPLLDDLLRKPSSTGLLIYPTKALSRDQLRLLQRFREIDASIDFRAGAYDGDTPEDLRRKLRNEGNLILTNPDMLHQGILPNHSRWNRFFSNLAYVVIDEIHTYRGIFGSNVANVMRRLKRIAGHYGSKPRFVCCSATISNPAELSEKIIGEPVVTIDRDGSPRGPKKFALLNPRLISRETGDRIGPNSEAKRLMSELVKNRVQTIAFTRTRLSAEIIYRYCQEELAKLDSSLANSIKAYRGGYLPQERREIERGLATGELLGVASTTALELGIDIGGLDACLIVGYPGTIASLWQQAGRAGRGSNEALAVLIARNSPVDQFLMKNTEYLFAQSPENAVIDPDNPLLAIAHLRCALYELPIRAEELELFGEYTGAMLNLLINENLVKGIKGQWYWANPGFPAAEINLRSMNNIVYTIIDTSSGSRAIGTIDESSAFLQVHPHAIYLHDGETYFVNELDTKKKIAFVEKKAVDYYTMAVSESNIRIDLTEEEKTWHRNQVCLGDTTVTSTVTMFRKIKFHTIESLGFESLDLPDQTLETTAFWLIPNKQALATVKKFKRIPAEGFIGIANVISEVMSLYVMCDTMDIGTVVESSNTGVPTLFVYDRYPGGMGFAARGFDLIDPIVEATLKVIEKCECYNGCPSCVGSPLPPFAFSSIDADTRGVIPDKEAALILLHALLEKPAYTPRHAPPERPVPGEKPAPKLDVKPLPPNLERKIRKRLKGFRR
ncbi:DEAD/DEAH box helicase [bacterium]|nr:DEAD/DEAH box helicase [bacterium]